MSAVIAAEPSAAGETRAGLTLALPALMLFAGVVVIPLVMTVMLSFHDWGQYKGIEPVFILKNWREIIDDPYYAEMFWRTFRIAAFATLITAVFGVPEAYILNRMRAPWKGLFLLLILGPLLETQLRTSLMASLGDPTVFVTRPISATLLAIAAFLLVLAVLPAIRGKRDEVFTE